MLSKKLIRNITLFYHETTHENPLVSLACYFFKINATPLLAVNPMTSSITVRVPP